MSKNMGGAGARGKSGILEGGGVAEEAIELDVGWTRWWWTWRKG